MNIAERIAKRMEIAAKAATKPAAPRKTGWVTDSKGNRASVKFWGSLDKARASLATLKKQRLHEL